ncbi:MAG: cation:proton antiporter [Verrucomicrobia bacterium]|nr:cation:proton antiporter [Verrucomicrobiota bacterium]
MHADLLADIGRCILVSVALAYVAHLIRQPLILAYIAAGVLLGKHMGFGWLDDVHSIETISEIGLILLLFMIGLEMDLKKIREAGKVVTLTGVVQVTVCAGLGWLFFRWLGIGGGQFDALYLAVCTAMSSTLIVVKLLHDKIELDTLPGRITLGVLVLQDVAAILFIAVQPNLQDPRLLPVLLSFVKGVGLIVMAFAATRYVLPPLFRRIAKVPELVLAGSLAWCFLVVAAADAAGLSRAMGALIGGVSISTFPYNLDVISKLTSLRDFFITLFFVALGADIPQPTPGLLLAAVGCSIFVAFSRYVSVTPLLLSLRNGHRVSLIPAINLANVSEFSIVIAAVGLKAGHISEAAQTLIVLAFAVTATVSTYKISYNFELQRIYSRGLKRLGVRDLDQTETLVAAAHPRLMLLGFAKVASSLLEEIERRAPALKERMAVVDFNPEAVHELRQHGIRVHYGDISHTDSLRHAGIEHAEIVVSTIPDHYLKGISNRHILQLVRQLNPKAQVVVTAETLTSARELYAAGADYVSVPRINAAADLLPALEKLVAGATNSDREAFQAVVKQRHEIIP